jgi:cytochrome c peroxidase
VLAAVLATGVGSTATPSGAEAHNPAIPQSNFYANTFEKSPSAASLTELGRTLFFEPALSASGKMSCASCHDPQHDFAAPNELAVQRGGADGRSFGVRAVPSLKYTQNVPPFTEHYVDDEEDDSVDQGPAGGRMWDGRASSVHDQARLPLFSPFEMANTDADTIVAKMQAGHWAQFREVFGEHVFADRRLAFKGMLLALEAFQQSPEEFYPYSSKYDAYLRRQTALSAQELRGLEAFNDTEKGNCARCHPSAKQKGAFPQFTDFGFAAIGAPRNAAIPANARSDDYDLGLCGPWRVDLKDRREYCGMFRTPSLRNAARRRVFLHNGVFHSLQDVVRFYAERDTQPQKWYPRTSDGRVMKFDDLPAPYRSNLDVQPPFDRHAGDAAALNEQDIADIVAFLKTLNDGFKRGNL